MFPPSFGRAPPIILSSWLPKHKTKLSSWGVSKANDSLLQPALCESPALTGNKANTNDATLGTASAAGS